MNQDLPTIGLSTDTLPPLASCKPSGNPEKTRAGIGMPFTLYLQDFGLVLWDTFAETPYHVGSSLTGALWRDVDVRVMLEADRYEAMGLGDSEHPHENARWCAYTKAFSLLGQKMTGLPIDFQLQETETANKQYSHARSALILGVMRRGKTT